MSQVTLQLPQTLLYRLESLAEHEGVSLSEYIVYLLACQTRAAYTVQPLSQQDTAEQRAQFHELLAHLGKAAEADSMAVLNEREVVEPEAGLQAGAGARFEEKIAAARQTRQKTVAPERH
jgi:exonuclease V gamma subunit